MWIILILILILVTWLIPETQPFLIKCQLPHSQRLIEVATSIISGLIIFIIGLNWESFRSFITANRLFLRFIFGGKAIEKGIVNVTLDTYKDIRLLPENLQKQLIGSVVPQNSNRFFKLFPDGHITWFPGAFEHLMGYCSARASSYLIAKLSHFLKQGVAVISDDDVGSKWEENTFINLGSSASNIRTNDIKHHKANIFLKEDINGKFELKNNKSFNFPDDRHDVGIILKMKSPYSKGCSLLICAGIGEWGTSGSAWYLSRYWKKLAMKYLTNDFIVVVSVVRGSDDTASIIYSSDSWLTILLKKYKIIKASNKTVL